MSEAKAKSCCELFRKVIQAAAKQKWQGRRRIEDDPCKFVATQYCWCEHFFEAGSSIVSEAKDWLSEKNRVGPSPNLDELLFSIRREAKVRGEVPSAWPLTLTPDRPLDLEVMSRLTDRCLLQTRTILLQTRHGEGRRRKIFEMMAPKKLSEARAFVFHFEAGMLFLRHDPPFSLPDESSDFVTLVNAMKERKLWLDKVVAKSRTPTKRANKKRVDPQAVIAETLYRYHHDYRTGELANAENPVGLRQLAQLSGQTVYQSEKFFKTRFPNQGGIAGVEQYWALTKSPGRLWRWLNALICPESQSKLVMKGIVDLSET